MKYRIKRLYYRIISRKKKIFTKIADIIGSIIFLPFILFNSKRPLPDNTKIRKILIIRTAFLGDVIMTIPVLKPLKEIYPDAKITFLTSSTASEILQNNPYVDRILEYDAFWFYKKRAVKAIRDHIFFLKELRSGAYDLVIDARGDIRDILLLVFPSKGRYKVSYGVGGGWFLLTHVVPFRDLNHRVDYHLDIARYLGAKINNFEWTINIPPDKNKIIKTLLSREGINPSDLLIGIHPGGRRRLKCWSRDGFSEVADFLISEYGAKVVFTGSPEERNLVDEIIFKMKYKAVNTAGNIDILGLSALIKNLNLFICNDTAPLHIASAMKMPTIAIFGPSKSKETGPYGNLNRVIEEDYSCRYTCDEKICNYEKYNDCMNAISSEDVLNAVREILDKDNI